MCVCVCVCVCVCECVCSYVCFNIFDSGEKTARPIGTGEVPFYAPERGKKMLPIAERSVPVGGTWHMPPREPFHDFIIRRYRSYYWMHVNQIRWADSHHERVLAFVLADTEGCRRHVLKAEN